MASLEFFRATPLNASIPTDEFLRQVTKVVRYRLEEVLQQMYATNSGVNLAVNNWIDPRGRRCQGVTTRMLRGTETTVALPMLKEIKVVHESGDLLIRTEGGVMRSCHVRAEAIAA
jgi:hypothetical protein